jgi:ribosome recycling factor
MFGWKYSNDGQLIKVNMPRSFSEVQKAMLRSVNIHSKELKASAIKIDKIKVGKLPF